MSEKLSIADKVRGVLRNQDQAASRQILSEKEKLERIFRQGVAIAMAEFDRTVLRHAYSGSPISKILELDPRGMDLRLKPDRSC